MKFPGIGEIGFLVQEEDSGMEGAGISADMDGDAVVNGEWWNGVAL